MGHYALHQADGTRMITLDQVWLHDNYDADMHVHARLELSYVKSGSGLYEIGDRTYELKKGDVVLINNTEPHRIVIRPNESLCNAVIHFEPEWIWNTERCDLDYRFLHIFFERGPLFSHVLDRDNPATAEIFRMLENIEKEFEEKKDGHELMIKVGILNVLAHIVRCYDYCKTETTKSMPMWDVAMMATAASYIKEHLSEKITLESLGKLVNMNPSYFSTRFKYYNGLSPMAYITEQRVNRAITMIHNSDKNLTEIAFACGFHHMSSFVKAFYKVTGNAPSFYRNKEEK